MLEAPCQVCFMDVHESGVAVRITDDTTDEAMVSDQ